MRAGNGLGQLMEQRLLHLYKLRRIHDLKDILDFIEVHDFLGTVHFRPVAQQPKDNLQPMSEAGPDSECAKRLTSSVRAESFSKN